MRHRTRSHVVEDDLHLAIFHGQRVPSPDNQDGPVPMIVTGSRGSRPYSNVATNADAQTLTPVPTITPAPTNIATRARRQLDLPHIVS